MSASERRKGAEGEREIIRLLRTFGYPDAVRTSDGRGQIERGDIADGPAGLHLEIKRRETAEIWKWLADAQRDAGDRIPVVCFRRSRSDWYAALPLEDLLLLVSRASDPG